MDKLVKLMVDRGWPKDDIEYTLNLLTKKRTKNSEMKQNMDRFVYWMSLLVIALTNFIGSFFLIPFFFILQGVNLFIFIILFALTFGFLFNFLIMGTEQLEWKHHLFAGVLIPLLTIFDIKIMLRFTDIISEEFNKALFYDANSIIIIFVFAFISPYLVSIIIGKHKIYYPYQENRMDYAMQKHSPAEDSLPDVDEKMLHYTIETMRHGEDLDSEDKISIRSKRNRKDRKPLTKKTKKEGEEDKKRKPKARRAEDRPNEKKKQKKKN
jgi:hypothetical protein